MISSFVEVKALLHVEKGVSMNDPSKNRRHFLPSLYIKSYGVRSKSGWKRSSQNGNAATCLLHHSLLRVFSTLERFLMAEV